MLELNLFKDNLTLKKMVVKIIATIGPSSLKTSIMEKMMKRGLDIGRINMKHSSFEEASKIIKVLSKHNCKILIDIENIKDIDRINGLKMNYLALSFTESAFQIKKLRKKLLPKKAFIIAKIENDRGTKNIEEIIKEADGIMIARGDLGNNVPLEKIPAFQKLIIKKCNSKKKFVITATEMLLSMINSKRPTRAEVSDVANAVLDGSDALMLSEETAIGKYPAESISMMSKIIEETLKTKRALN
jgi:pyruvate kinase